MEKQFVINFERCFRRRLANRFILSLVSCCCRCCCFFRSFLVRLCLVCAKFALGWIRRHFYHVVCVEVTRREHNNCVHFGRSRRSDQQTKRNKRNVLKNATGAHELYAFFNCFGISENGLCTIRKKRNIYAKNWIVQVTASMLLFNVKEKLKHINWINCIEWVLFFRCLAVHTLALAYII